MRKINNKGAVELSIGTVVILVIGMSMLILGLVLVKTIFTGSIDNVTELNDKVKEEIKNLFVNEDERATIKLTERTATVKQGDEFGIAFGIKNTAQGSIGAQTFRYSTILDDTEIQQNCGVSKTIAESWIKFGSGSLSISPGEVDSALIKAVVPEDAPLCETKYRIIIYRPSEGETADSPYEDLSFFLKIESGGLF